MISRRAGSIPDGATYKRSIVSFFDILGFEQLVLSKSASELLEILEEFGHRSNPGSDDYEYGAVTAIRFSDSVIRIRDLTFTVPEDEPTPSSFLDRREDIRVLIELYDILMVQHALMLQGVLLRGGVSVGDCYVKGDIAFGPAIISAYRTESQLAQYPRIVVSEAIDELRAGFMRAFERGHQGSPWASRRAADQQLDLVYPLLRRSDDGLLYLDYLGSGLEKDKLLGEEGKAIFRAHAKLARNGLVASRNDRRVFMKYSWLASYHNVVVASTFDGTDDESVKWREEVMLDEHELDGAEFSVERSV